MYQNNGNILFISDDQQVLNRFRQAYVESYNVFTASSIQEAHRTLSAYDIHVVTVEQMMPEMSGLQFCESISHEFSNLTNIIISRSEDTNSLERAYKTGLIFRFISEPFTNVDLQMAIDNALQIHKAHFENKKLSERISSYEEEQQDILDLFKKYVPGEVVSQALKTKKEDIMKPGESRVVSVLFADMRDFTKMTSELPPSEVVQFLNDYWDVLSIAIKENKGSINKYIGDGLLAVFGAPVSHLNNHKNAVSAALDMVGLLDRINIKYSEKLGSEISIGIGINSGEVIVGNVGTDDFMEYTVIGNTVNTASRLEKISKNKPNSIIISERTHNLVKDSFQTSELKETTLSEKTEVIKYCEVFGPNPGNVFPMNSKSNIQ
ncbi:adenylate/guanylate cyclase domain-containing response regulator [Aliifodinibius salipaludis]|uniref:Adenylate/guanylate cyclase domain-containing response regulator n=1 Tax=Fodinibius salipaludis TaxID=2032627 RepID=A0A2A2G9F6_9BACT|nr:adenylate/guanylate cyclase domain-containing protein [Aliifodinibius salipaludis]PAU93485.1 adenylate/guanylate cyclase domain-containing response regulator [Aliifodinibius salipaludis]